MKIKTDFVTNSSSTAFVVMVPNNFYIDEGEIKNLYDNECSSDKKIKYEELLKEIPECIESLKEADNLWCYGMDGLHPTIYNIILDMCVKHNFILSTLNIDNEGNNIIQGVKEETIKNILINNMDIMSMFESILREDKDVNAKNK
jgi:hypothetical protein